MHLLYECAWCFEPLWKLVGEAITARQDSPTAQTYRTDVHSAIYNIYDGQIPWQHAGQVMSWFQVIKRDLIYCRFKRCMGRAIQPDRSSLPDYYTGAYSLAIQLSGTKSRRA